MSSAPIRTFISWTLHDTRTDGLAHHLNARCHHIHYFRDSRYRLALAPLNYLLASLETIRILLRERPGVILVQNPPVFAVLIVWFYSRLSGAGFITDSHSAAFDMRRWMRLLWLYRLLGRHALTNIVHNQPLADRVRSWGLPVSLVGDIAYEFAAEGSYPVRAGFNAAVVGTYAPDEPLEEVLKAAASLPDVGFYLTGSLRRAPADLRSRVPANVVLTDFLPHAEYGALLKSCDVVVVLTTRDNTMQNGAYEALELARPIITSDWPVLRDTFVKGAIFVDNSAAGLVAALRELQADYSRYAAEISTLREERRRVWERSLAGLLAVVESAPGPSPSRSPQC